MMKFISQNSAKLSIQRLIVILLAVLYISSAGNALATQIDYMPPIKAFKGNDIMVEAELTNAKERVSNATVYYRDGGQGTFIPLEMEVDQWNLLAFIPAADVVAPAMEYYIEVEYTSGTKEAFPSGAPNKDIYHVNVISLKSNKDMEPVLEIISPEPGESFDEGDDVLVAFSLAQHVRRIDPDNIRIELGGVDITRKAYKSESIISLLMKDMRAGSHSLSIFEMHGSDKIMLNNWSFNIEREELRHYGPDLPFDGSIGGRFNHEDISQNTRDVTIGDLSLRGGSQDFKWAGKVYVTSLEDAEKQPQNRYLGMMKYKGTSLKVGDTSPRFSQFTIYGNRTRGVEFNLDTKVFTLDVASGNLMRPIEGSNVAGSVTNGTYRRSLLAVQPGFALSRNSKLKFSILKAKDDIESIDFGSSPEDNLVVGGGLDWSSSSRRFTLASETAISLYNSDISSGPMSQAADLEKIIVVNQFFDPLPTDESILDDNTPQQELAKKVFSELFKSSLAHETSLGMQLWKNNVKFAYKTVGKSFKSLGSNGVSTDIRGFSISDRVRMFDSKVYLNLAYSTYQDNVNGKKPEEETLTKNTISGGISYYTAPDLPNVSFNVRQYGRENSDNYTEVDLPDGSIDSTGNPVSDNSMSYGISVDHAFKFGQTEHSTVLSYNTAFSEDDYNANAASDNTSIGLRIGSKINYRLDTSFSFSTTTQNSLDGNNSVGYNAITLGGKYKLIPRRLTLNGSFGMNFASGGNDALNPAPASAPETVLKSSSIDFSRMQLTVGGEYKLGSNHKFGLSAYQVFHSDDSYVTYWDNNDVYNKDSATFVEQDDFVTRMSYTYTF